MGNNVGTTKHTSSVPIVKVDSTTTPSASSAIIPSPIAIIVPATAAVVILVLRLILLLGWGCPVLSGAEELVLVVC